MRKGWTSRPKLGDKCKELRAQKSGEGGRGNRKRADMLKIESRTPTVNCLGKNYYGITCRKDAPQFA